MEQIEKEKLIKELCNEFLSLIKDKLKDLSASDSFNITFNILNNCVVKVLNNALPEYAHRVQLFASFVEQVLILLQEHRESKK